MATLSRNTESNAKFSIPSILAIICGVLAFSTSAGTATFAAIGAMVFGIIGALMSILPGRRGGFASVAFIFIGALGFVIGLLRLIF